MSKIFISYRRQDSRWVAGRIYDRIEEHFQPEQIFMDIDMEPGLDFAEELEAAVESCDVLLAVIGPEWLTMADEAGRRRLDDEQDWVRLEIATALRRRVRVIPCLVEGTRMPRADELPEDLAPLTRRQALTLSHERFRSDAEHLTRAIAKVLDGNAKPAQPSKPTEPASPSEGTIKQSPQDGLEYVWIPPGSFQMGAVPGDKEALKTETPRHAVAITKGFWLGRTPVTVLAYKRFAQAISDEMPEAPQFNSSWAHDDHPIVNVTWNEARAYCQWVGGRLPTEAEWEYAARGGKEGWQYPHGNELIEGDAHFAADRTCPVGKHAANGYRLLDMAGNVWEWCSDFYDRSYYKNSPRTDPRGGGACEMRIMRGGSWNSKARSLRSSYRGRYQPEERFSNFGFRCARDVFP